MRSEVCQVGVTHAQPTPQPSYTVQPCSPLCAAISRMLHSSMHSYSCYIQFLRRRSKCNLPTCIIIDVLHNLCFTCRRDTQKHRGAEARAQFEPAKDRGVRKGASLLYLPLRRTWLEWSSDMPTTPTSTWETVVYLRTSNGNLHPRGTSTLVFRGGTTHKVWWNPSLRT